MTSFMKWYFYNDHNDNSYILNLFSTVIRKLIERKKKGVKGLEKTRKIMLGVTTTALTMGLAGCDSSTAELPSQPTDQGCDDWDWDDDQGVWVCDDQNSSHRGYYYYGGHYYQNKNALLKSADYTNYKNSSSYKGGSKSSSGFGSGSKSSGG